MNCKKFIYRTCAVLGLAAAFALLPARLSAQTPALGNTPHGSASTGCNASCQATELGLVENQLYTQVQALPTGTNCPNGQSTRDLVNGALANLILNSWNSASVTQAGNWINCAFLTLDSVGNVLQSVGYTGANDQNSTEFAMIGLGSMLTTGRGSQHYLFTNLTSNSHANIKQAMITLSNHINNTSSGNKLDQTSTNMYLMNTAARMLMSQALDNQGVGVNYSADLTQSENQLYAFLYYVQREGFHEFDSSTYAATQMEALVEGYLWATNAPDKSNFKLALDYLWMDLANNFFQPGIRLVPPYSRNYSFINGQGSTAAWEEVMGGWMTETSSGPYNNVGGTFQVTAGGSGILTNGALALEGAMLLDEMNQSYAYPVSATNYNYAIGTGSNLSVPSHVNLQLWGTPTNDTNPDTPWKTVGVYQNLTAGCTGGSYGPQDKLFGISLAGSSTDAGANRNLTIIGNSLDSTGLPYGFNNVVGKDGSSKPNHVAENPSCAIYAGLTQTATLLSTYFDANKRSDGSGNQGLWSNILFPSNVGNFNKDSRYPVVSINEAAPVCNAAQQSGTTGGTTIVCPMYLTRSGSDITTGDVVTWQRYKGNGTPAGFAGFKMLEINPGPVTPSGTYAAAGATGYQMELDLCDSVFNPDPCDSNYTGRIVVTHANTSAPVNSKGTAPQFVTYLFVTDDTATTADGIYAILKNATYTTTTDGVNQTLAAIFNSSYRPGGVVTSLKLTRSDTVFTDPGTITVNSISGKTPVPAASGPLTVFSASNSYGSGDGVTTIATAGSVVNSTTVNNPNGWSCTQTLCSAATQ